MRMAKGNWWAAALCVAMLAAGGCGSLYTQADHITGVGFMLGKLEGPLHVVPKQAVPAIDRAFAEMHITKRYQAFPHDNVDIVAVTQSGKKLTLTVKRTVTGRSQIAIGVGTFGDEVLSRALYEKILTALERAPAARPQAPSMIPMPLELKPTP